MIIYEYSAKQNKYSQKRNCANPQSQFSHSYDRPAYSAARKYVDRSWKYIYIVHRHMNVEILRAFLYLEIQKWDFRCSVDSSCNVSSTVFTTVEDEQLMLL